MARQPSYPKDAPVGEPAAESAAAPDTAEKSEKGGVRTKSLVTGAAIGIGSAALVAALLYANRARKIDKSS
jgi:hypothetical protein